ncbi:MAG: glycosyltransferase family 4 protein [Acidimicrobiales bacterium]|nr:glycosyltransferase family 4 protein [Acidimicrobiales bacterium]HRW36316.1 glycosyltransferase family 4 protein [Aquihabitans sp.]
MLGPREPGCETAAMDVLVCTTQVPFMRGGLEMMVENLVGALGAAGHRAEAVAVPAAWDRDRLLDAPTAWRSIPLDADVVIPVNFPAFYARHPRKVLWLAHQHRAAYDGLGQPWSDLGLDEASLAAHRQLVDWDTRVLSECLARFTISGVVADRLRRFNGLDATALYQPPPLADRLAPRPGGPGRHLLCPTRLEANKRPGLFLDGLASMATPVDGILTGVGSLADELRGSAERLGIADRLEMPGFVSDDDLVDLLREAIAVVYAPYDEDYGFVTLQAFLAGVPVVTTDDSGGVLEWVEHEVTGLVTDGSPDALGAALDRLVADPELALRLGAAGRERVRDLNWEHVVRTLLGGSPP